MVCLDFLRLDSQELIASSNGKVKYLGSKRRLVAGETGDKVLCFNKVIRLKQIYSLRLALRELVLGNR